jgi:hypothetical protein
MTTDDVDIFSARTRRRLARSPYAPIPEDDDDMAQLRVDVLGRLLLERLASLGPLPEPVAVDVLDARAPGRGREAVTWAIRAGLVARVTGDDGEPTLQALSVPRTLAA